MTDADDEPFDRVPLNAVPTVVWRISGQLITAVAEALGDPVDSYVNGSQVWIDEDGPVAIEWRLHPVANYERPKGMSTTTVFETVVRAVATGSSEIDVHGFWGGLEAFPAFHDACDPEALRVWSSEKIGMTPDAWGRVDHDAIADRWERSGRATSIVAELLEQLGRRGSPSW